MSRVYWDTMLFAYWFRDDPDYAPLVSNIWSRMRARNDELLTSTFTIGESLVSATKAGDEAACRFIREFFASEVRLIPIDMAAVDRFAQIRATTNAKPPDAIHLACAATLGVDLFLTNDRRLRNLKIEGIDFIDGLGTTALGID